MLTLRINNKIIKININTHSYVIFFIAMKTIKSYFSLRFKIVKVKNDTNIITKKYLRILNRLNTIRFR